MITAPVGNLYLSTEISDMNKSINTLWLLVEDALELNPVGPHWFVFCNHRCDKLKILQGISYGFGLHPASMPRQPLTGSIATAGTFTTIAIRKYVDGLPLYHIEKELARVGIVTG